MLLVDKGTEALCQDQVTQVLVMQQYLVLVIQHFLRTATVVCKGQLMGINRHGGIEGLGAEPDILVA